MVLSVVAVDLVAYSQKSVAEQVALKDNFNKLLLRAISDIAVADRIILDTGDGVAIGFLGDPEDALYVAMFMHLAINRGAAGKSPDGAVGKSGDKDTGRSARTAIRIGINVGPVKLAVGLGGHPNIIGDGINVAERIMSFAEPGQLTASRSFYEVMSRSSGPYTTLFKYAGLRTDNQVREHEVYLVGKSVLAFQQAELGVAERAAQRAGKPASSSILPDALIRPGAPPASPAPSASASLLEPTTSAESAPPVPAHAPTQGNAALIDFLEDRQKVAGAAVVLAIIAVILAALLGYRKFATMRPAPGVPEIAASNPPTERREISTGDAAQLPAPVVPAKDPAKDAGSTRPGKAESRPSLAIAPAITSPGGRKAAEAVATPPKVSPSVAPTRASERVMPPVLADASAPKAAGEMPKSAKVDKVDKMEKVEKVDKVEKTDREPRKVLPPRGAGDREKTPPISNVPFVPAYQSPAEAPKPEPVAPTPAPSLSPPAPSLDTNAVVVSRTAPAYPVEGIRQGIASGFVKARLTIDAAGNVTNVNILETRPIVAFGRETRQTLKDWKFNPGAPGRTYDIELTFKPK